MELLQAAGPNEAEHCRLLGLSEEGLLQAAERAAKGNKVIVDLLTKHSKTSCQAKAEGKAAPQAELKAALKAERKPTRPPATPQTTPQATRITTAEEERKVKQTARASATTTSTTNACPAGPLAPTPAKTTIIPIAAAAGVTAEGADDARPQAIIAISCTNLKPLEPAATKNKAGNSRSNKHKGKKTSAAKAAHTSTGAAAGPSATTYRRSVGGAGGATAAADGTMVKPPAAVAPAAVTQVCTKKLQATPVQQLPATSAHPPALASMPTVTTASTLKAHTPGPSQLAPVQPQQQTSCGGKNARRRANKRTKSAQQTQQAAPQPPRQKPAPQPVQQQAAPQPAAEGVVRAAPSPITPSQASLRPGQQQLVRKALRAPTGQQAMPAQLGKGPAQRVFVNTARGPPSQVLTGAHGPLHPQLAAQPSASPTGSTASCSSYTSCISTMSCSSTSSGSSTGSLQSAVSTNSSMTGRKVVVVKASARAPDGTPALLAQPAAGGSSQQHGQQPLSASVTALQDFMAAVLDSPEIEFSAAYNRSSLPTAPLTNNNSSNRCWPNAVMRSMGRPELPAMLSYTSFISDVLPDDSTLPGILLRQAELLWATSSQSPAVMVELQHGFAAESSGLALNQQHEASEAWQVVVASFRRHCMGSSSTGAATSAAAGALSCVPGSAGPAMDACAGLYLCHATATGEVQGVEVQQCLALGFKEGDGRVEPACLGQLLRRTQLQLLDTGYAGGQQALSSTLLKLPPVLVIEVQPDALLYKPNTCNEPRPTAQADLAAAIGCAEDLDLSSFAPLHPHARGTSRYKLMSLVLRKKLAGEGYMGHSIALVRGTGNTWCALDDAFEPVVYGSFRQAVEALVGRGGYVPVLLVHEQQRPEVVQREPVAILVDNLYTATNSLGCRLWLAVCSCQHFGVGVRLSVGQWAPPAYSVVQAVVD